ncbi:MAG TPA: DNA/RNA non-specific endonuclease [archaeon]|nr:DNA/RNA non-specific endonuclease [archaeon]
MKRFITFFISLLVCLSFEPARATMRCDINNDGKVNIFDVIAFLGHLSARFPIKDAESQYYTLTDHGAILPASVQTHVILGIPVSDPADIFLQRIGFLASYNPGNKVSDWVSYKLKKEYVEAPALLSGRPFNPDPDIPVEFSAVDDDYTNSGYDRGHLAREADMRGRNIYCEFESCFFTNIAPQLPGLNRSTWLVLENRVQDWAVKYDSVWVFSGPIYEGDAGYIGNRVAVPSHYFKIVSRFSADTLKTLAFILAQTASSDELSDYVATVDEIESKTRIDFFHELPDNIENLVEAQKNELWPVSDR